MHEVKKMPEGRKRKSNKDVEKRFICEKQLLHLHNRFKMSVKQQEKKVPESIKSAHLQFLVNKSLSQLPTVSFTHLYPDFLRVTSPQFALTSKLNVITFYSAGKKNKTEKKLYDSVPALAFLGVEIYRKGCYATLLHTISL